MINPSSETLIELKQEVDRQRQELEALKAQLMGDFYTVSVYAALRGISIRTSLANLLAHKCLKLSTEYGVLVGKSSQSVNTYHVDILCEVFTGQ